MSSVFRRAALRAISARPFSAAASLPSSRAQVACAPLSRASQRKWALTNFQRAFTEQASSAKERDVTEAETTSASEPLVEASGDATTSERATETSQQAGEIEKDIGGAGAETAAPVADAEKVFVNSAAPEEAAEVAAATAAAAAPVTPSVDTRSSRPSQDGQVPFGTIPPNKTLYVGNMFFETAEADLQQFFEEFGTIESVKIIHDQRGISKGFGYVVFADIESATRAVEGRNQDVFQGRRITVQYHRPRASVQIQAREPTTPSRTLFIGNMSFEMSDKDLNDLFREIRNVLDVRVAIDRRSGQPRGFAHADFVDEPSATKAMAVLKGKEIYGRQLRVDYSASSVREPRQ